MKRNDWLCKTILTATMGLSPFAPAVFAAAPPESNLQAPQQSEIKVTGKVVDPQGVELPGATVMVKGSKKGTVTDIDGKFSLSVPAGSTIVISYVGYNTVELPAKANMDVTLQEDTNMLSEVIVSGVAKGTSREKLSFSVEKVRDEALHEVPGTDVTSALNGKMPGIKVIPTSGNPNDEPIIQLRGALSFNSTSQPLIIIDGIVTDGSLKDINMEDVENIEVIKGAAAASFYGAKAAAGVISITTKRGSNMSDGQVNVTFKSELGGSWVGWRPPFTTAHNRIVDENGYPTKVSDPDMIPDNPWNMTHNIFDQIFKTGFFNTETLGITGRSKSGDINYYVSIQNTKNPGVIRDLNGVNRTSFRANMDVKLSDKVTLTTSNMYVRTHSDDRYDDFGAVYFADPYADWSKPNVDGTPYYVNPNMITTWTLTNPLYKINNSRAESYANRYLGAYNLRYRPVTWLTLNAAYSIDFTSKDGYSLTPKGILKADDPTGANRENGYISDYQYNNFKHNLELGALFSKEWGDFTTNLKFQYLYEDAKYKYVSGSGSRLAVSGMDNISLDMADASTVDIYSDGNRIVNNSFTTVFQGDWRSEIMLDALYRLDGASVLGDDNLWNSYYRISAAWNAAKTFKIPGVQLLKPRLSYGTAGILPDYGWKYEVYSMSNGSLYGASQMGNSKLKAAMSREVEVGLDSRFLDRFDLAFSYAHKKNTDLPYMQTVSGITGFEYQYVNLGEFFINSWEISLNAMIMQNRNFSWDATLTWDRMTQRVGELGRPTMEVGIMRIESNKPYGELYGTKWARSLDEVKYSKDIKPGQSVEDVFTINNYGYVVKKSEIGTTQETKYSIKGEDGNNAKVYLGNQNPDFNMNLTNTMHWKGFTFYFTMSWQQGGLAFNGQRQYMSFAGNNANNWDMSVRPWEQRKAYRYLNSHPSDWSVESTTFLKMREISLNYAFNRSQLRHVGLGFLQGIKLGVVGRNLFTLTHYAGSDPESRYLNRDNNNGGVLVNNQQSNYPGDTRTVTGTIAIEF